MDVDGQNPFSTNVSIVVHELAQCLLIINAYARGSIERIKNNNLTIEQLKSLLIKIQLQIELMFKIIQGLVTI